VGSGEHHDASACYHGAPDTPRLAQGCSVTGAEDDPPGSRRKRSDAKVALRVLRKRIARRQKELDLKRYELRIARLKDLLWQEIKDRQAYRLDELSPVEQALVLERTHGGPYAPRAPIADDEAAWCARFALLKPDHSL
jgi:hypothetical protein